MRLCLVLVCVCCDGDVALLDFAGSLEETLQVGGCGACAQVLDVHCAFGEVTRGHAQVWGVAGPGLGGVEAGEAFLAGVWEGLDGGDGVHGHHVPAWWVEHGAVHHWGGWEALHGLGHGVCHHGHEGLGHGHGSHHLSVVWV